jgi:RNA polymerase sigma-70 factor (ECF subfamily)
MLNRTAETGPQAGDADQDSQLVQQAKAGDMSAFDQLVLKYQDRIVNTCWRLSGNLEDAYDLAQEAFMRALESMNSFRHEARFYTWLFRIAVNLAITQRRKTGRNPTLSLNTPVNRDNPDHQASELVNRMADKDPGPLDKAANREAGEKVAEALDELEDNQRILIVLRDIESFDYHQIAEILSLPVGTVKSRLHRARMCLRDRLKPVLMGGQGSKQQDNAERKPEQRE